MPILSQRVKTCDQCNGQFFLSQDGNAGYEIVCEDDSAFFCSPYCRALWLTDQFKFIETDVYEGSQYGDSSRNNNSNAGMSESESEELTKQKKD